MKGDNELINNRSAKGVGMRTCTGTPVDVVNHSKSQAKSEHKLLWMLHILRLVWCNVHYRSPPTTRRHFLISKCSLKNWKRDT